MTRLSPNVKGIALMTLAMALLAAGDAMIKIMSDEFAQPVFMVVSGAGLVASYFLISIYTGDQILSRRAFEGAALVRSIAEICAALSMIVALSKVPFTILTLVMQAMPLVVTFGAVIFFKEKVGPRRWLAIGVGFIGVLIILRPGGEIFSPTWLFAVIATLALSARDLASRAVPKDLSTLQISTWGGIGVVLAGVFLHFIRQDPLPEISANDIPGFVFIVACWASGVFAVTAAMRLGDVGVVAPFRYTRLPFGLLVGVLVFSETVDAAMIIGVVIIVASGLFIFLRERSS